MLRPSVRHMSELKGVTLQGIPFIDFNLMFEDLKLNIKQDYRDGGDHLNYQGATKTTAYLSDFLYEKYSDILTDRRNDENYSFWEETNQEFKEKYNVA